MIAAFPKLDPTCLFALVRHHGSKHRLPRPCPQDLSRGFWSGPVARGVVLTPGDGIARLTRIGWSP